MTVGSGNKLWQKTEGGSGGSRGHSNMAHREHTGPIKDGARRARRQQDVRVIEEELEEIQGSLTAAQIRAISGDDD